MNGRILCLPDLLMHGEVVERAVCMFWDSSVQKEMHGLCFGKHVHLVLVSWCCNCAVGSMHRVWKCHV